MTGDVLREGSAETQLPPRYMIVDLNQSAVSVLERVPRPSLFGRFGERAGAPSTVIGVGDSVQVTIWEAASGGLFSSAAIGGVTAGSHSASIPEQIVGRDGSITVPYAGRIRVAGLTTAQVERKIIAELAGKAIEPQALVTVPRNISNMVTVTGEVTTGARVPLSNRGDRILDVIAAAGGVRAPVHDVFISLTRGDATARVPMRALMANPHENIYVRPDDVITVVQEPQTFTVFGAAGRNALVPFDASGLTAEEAVAKSGGILDGLADPEGVFLLRSEPLEVARQFDPSFPIEPGSRYVNVVYRLNFRDANTYFVARHMPIRNKDMIYVAASMSSEYQKAVGLFMTTLNAAAGPAVTAYTVSHM
jgi:polysaccharide export outer membrane protein